MAASLAGPGNAGCPVSASSRTRPSEYTSAAAVTAEPVTCSGAMYAAVPMVVAVAVSRAAVDQSGDTEVSEQHPAVVCQQNVRRLHVPVDDASTMDVGQGVGDRGPDACYFARLERATRELVGQRSALHQLQDDEDVTVGLPGVIHPDQIGVAETGQ